MKRTIGIVVFNIIAFLFFFNTFSAYARENNYGIVAFTLFIIFYVLCAGFISLCFLVSPTDADSQVVATSSTDTDKKDDEIDYTNFDNSDENAYHLLFGSDQKISATLFTKAWQNDEKVIDFIDKNYYLMSHDPLAQFYVFERLTRVGDSDSEELLEKTLIKIKNLIAQERPCLGDFVPCFFDKLYNVAEGDTFWDGYFSELTIEMIKWLEGNPYRYCIYKFWNETCGVDTYREGEITKEYFENDYIELKPLYEAAKADLHLAEQKLTELEPDSHDYLLYKKLQNNTVSHLKYYNI